MMSNSNNDPREEYIQALEEFKRLLYSYRQNGSLTTRTAINKKSNYVQRLVNAAHASKTMTIAPPPAVGGIVMHDLNPFDIVFKDFYGLDIIQHVIDIVDEAIGNIELDKNFSLEVIPTIQNLSHQTLNKKTKSMPSKETIKILGMTQEAFWPLVVAAIGASFYIGLRLGQAKFDSEKIDLYNSNQSYKVNNYNLLKQLGVEQKDEDDLKDSLRSVKEQLHMIKHSK